MTDKTDLQNALKDAMRANDDLRKRTLRMALSAIRLAEVDKGRQLDEQEILSILQKEVKTRQEAIEEARGANRPQLEADAQAEIEVLQKYLPQPLTQEELEAMARQAVDEVGATSQREMGQVMKVLVPRLQGKATGKQASEVVRKLLE
jgi:uncharacterized protein YqeY